MSQNMVEAEILCKQTAIPPPAAAATAYHVCVAKEQNFQIDVNVVKTCSCSPSPTTTAATSAPVLREVCGAESVSADLPRFESVRFRLDFLSVFSVD